MSQTHPTKTSRKPVLKSVRPKRALRHFADICQTDRQTDRQTDAGSSCFGDKYSITDHTIRLSEVAVPLNLKDPFLTDKENLGSAKGRLCWATRSWRWYPGLLVSFPGSFFSIRGRQWSDDQPGFFVWTTHVVKPLNEN